MEHLANSNLVEAAGAVLKMPGQQFQPMTANADCEVSVGSFFDIFTELSTDGGATWSPANEPGYMEAHIDPGVPPTTMMEPRITNGIPTFTVASQASLNYLLQFKETLTDPTWTTISITPGTGALLDLVDCCPPPGPSRPHRFYRVEIQENDNY